MKNRRRLSGVLAFALISAIVLCCGVCAVDASIALRVNYNGKKIATVRNEEEYQSAVTVVTRMVCGSNVESVMQKPVFDTVLVDDTLIDDQETVVQAIIENTEEILHAYTLTVDGEAVAFVDNADLSLWLEERRTAFDTDENCVSSFVKQVSVEDGYYLLKDTDTELQVRAIINSLAVQTVRTESHEGPIPYRTLQERNKAMLVGQQNTLVVGQNGSQRVTETTVYLNGEVSVPTVSEATVLTEPVNEVIEIGVGTKSPSSGNRVNSGFVFPLPATGWKVSAYYGDGRNHRAVDIACDYGTPIYAVEAGTVEEACWDGQYGKCIIIDHGNGIKTRYAHASALYVSYGQTVAQGEQIAAVGKTGLATGNHLHFEVIIGGREVNPAPYIGL